MSLIRSWTSSINEATRVINKYQRGEIIPLSTGIDHLDLNLIGGLTSKKIISISGLSGHGKTIFSQRLINNIISLNPSHKIAVLKMNFEMTVQELLLRRLQVETKLSLEELLYKEPTDLPLFKSIVDKERNENIFHIEQALTPEQYFEECERFLEQHSDKDLVLIELDHVSLIVNSTDKKSAVDKVMEHTITLKQKFKNCSFLILAQLNRDIQSRTNIKEMAPRMSDLYQSSIMAFCSDLVIIIHQPSRLGIDRYLVLNTEHYNHLSPFFIEGNNDNWASLSTYKTIYYHYVKNRMSSEIMDVFGHYYGEKRVEKQYTSSLSNIDDF